MGIEPTLKSLPMTRFTTKLCRREAAFDAVLGEGIAPPESFRTRGLQPRAIAALPSQQVTLSLSLPVESNYCHMFIPEKSFCLPEPRPGFEPGTCCLQNSCSTTEPSRQADFTGSRKSKPILSKLARFYWDKIFPLPLS